MSLEEDPTDQIPTDHKEDVHTNKSAGDNLGKGVVDHDPKHSQCPQPIDVRSVSKGDHGATV
jgi:hypothetical protein